MSEYLQEHWKYLSAALVLHGGIAALFLVTFATQPVRVTPQLAIQATVVDAAVLRRMDQRQKQEEARAQAERDRQAQEIRDREEAERRREQEAEVEKTAAVERREAEAKQKEEAQKRAAADAQREAQAQKDKRAAADKAKAAEIEKRQKEAADKRKAQDAARAQASREAELKQQLAEEQGRMQAESAGLNNQYAALIEQRVYRNWNRPATARPGIECQIKVTQAPAGTVLSVEIGQCNGDAAVRQSIEAAVLRSSPLPPPPDARLFQRNILLIFKPQD
jgi:colicin import membrane protein